MPLVETGGFLTIRDVHLVARQRVFKEALDQDRESPQGEKLRQAISVASLQVKDEFNGLLHDIRSAKSIDSHGTIIYDEKVPFESCLSVVDILKDKKPRRLLSDLDPNLIYWLSEERGADESNPIQRKPIKFTISWVPEDPKFSSQQFETVDKNQSYKQTFPRGVFEGFFYPRTWERKATTSKCMGMTVVKDLQIESVFTYTDKKIPQSESPNTKIGGFIMAIGEPVVLLTK
jgi:hypothetical protein